MNQERDSLVAGIVPRIRPVELVPLELDGEYVVGIQDPLHVMEDILTVSPVAGLVIALFDGTHTIKQIADIVREHVQQAIPLEDIHSLARQLDERYLMATENFQARYRQLLSDFSSSSRREAYLAGRSYPAEPEALRQLIDSFFTCEDGPGLPDPASNGRPPLTGIIAPHIDLNRGGTCFAHAYRRLAESQPPDLLVILGTSHLGTPNIFAASGKTFGTPLGDVETDAEFLERLGRHFGDDLFADEFLHRSEHVIEFQTLFLQYLYGGRHPYKIVPILCSYSPEMTQSDKSPESAARIASFAKALKRTIDETPGRVCVISSADLAHLGPRYGDEQPLNGEGLSVLEQRDRAMLATVSNGDLEAFNNDMLKDEDKRRICGYPCIHTMLAAGAFDSGELLCYDQAQVDDQGSVVSFAGMVFGGAR